MRGLREDEMKGLKFKSCPECGNKTIKLLLEIPSYTTFSVRTGKCLEAPFFHGESVGGFFSCKCGWNFTGWTINELYEDVKRDEE